MSLKYALNFRRAWLTPTPQGRGSGAMRFDPAAVTPDVHIFTRSKLPWLALPMGARAFEAFYQDRRSLAAGEPCPLARACRDLVVSVAELLSASTDSSRRPADIPTTRRSAPVNERSPFEERSSR